MEQIQEITKSGDVVYLTEDKESIVKTVEVAGDGGACPQEGEEVLVDYVGRLEDGTVFGTSKDKEPFKFEIGVGSVIKGWDIGIMSMQVGEKAELRVASEFAYGAAGIPPTIPPNATLTFEVDLI